MFRRYRDLSIFAFIGVYLISIIDAYVDAELSNFDITPDLSMKVEPAVIDNNNQFRSSSLKQVGWSAMRITILKTQFRLILLLKHEEIS